MTRAFTQLCFSPAVKDAQARYGAREQRLLENKEPANDRLNEDLKAFIGANRTLAFADYAGNQQYITLGNLAENDRIFLFLVDYEHGRRLKIWGVPP